MNCPNCGADNEAGVRFCIECGTPLEDQTDAAPLSVEEEDDKTIMTSTPLVVEEAKTVAVTQEDVAAAAEPKIKVEVPASAESEPVSSQPAMPPPPPSAVSNGSSGSKNSRNIIIIVIVVLLVLCCCCTTLAIVGTASTDVIEDIMYELSTLALYRPLV